MKKKKKAWCAYAVVVLPIQPIAFLTFSLSSPSWPLKVPNMTCLEALLQTSISKTYFGLLISIAIACVEALFLTGYQPSYNPLRRCISPRHKVSHFPSLKRLIFWELLKLAAGGNFAEMQSSPEQSDKKFCRDLLSPWLCSSVLSILTYGWMWGLRWFWGLKHLHKPSS